MFMNYSVIKISGQQFRVKEGDEILVNKVKSKDKIQAQVLMSVNGEKVEIGTPTLNKKVDFEILSDLEKGKKIYVMKYKAKSRYRKKIGFRPQYTRLKVAKLS
ncbi:MAG: 50S ribosomal protein L21 [Patescibacteria group bacterium]|nr:50S ribosomal protein L21 [Patescibacteria group bacterium]